MTKACVYPPLGALTCVREPIIAFRVCFVHGRSDTEPIWEAEIWSNMGSGDQWQGMPLSRITAVSELALINVAQLGAGCHADQFSLDLPVTIAMAKGFEFTVRWRYRQESGGGGDWQWATSYGQNARVAVRPRLADPDKTPASFWRQQLRSLLRPADTNDHRVPRSAVAIADSWQVSPTGASCVLRPSSNDSADSKNGMGYFGQLDAVDGVLVFARKDPFWMVPRAGTDISVAAGLDVVLVLVELGTGAYAALMPFAKDTPLCATAVFCVGPDNALYLQVRPALDLASIRVAASVSRYAHGAISGLFERIQQALPQPSPSLPSQPLSPPPAAHPTLLSENMGYSTWNTFYQQVTHDGVVSELSDIYRIGHAAKQPTPEWVLIDDGWQTTSQYNGLGQLREICANKEKFPGQLRQTVDALTQIGTRRVGVWHALWGYWGGIDPGGLLAQQFALEQYHRCWSSAVQEETEIWLIPKASIAAFYDTFYEWLSSQGVTFVKVDYQGAFETLSEYSNPTADICSMRNAYYDAMERAAVKHFGPGSIIYCMSQTPHLLLRSLQRQLQCPSNSATVDTSQAAQCDLLRNSDDYYPNEASSHSWHIYCNMANALWSRELSSLYALDWDMFQPGAAESNIHAVARSLSGGPFYVSGAAAGYAHQDLTSIIGQAGQPPLRSPPLLGNRCLFTDMTATADFLVGATAFSEGSSVMFSVYNVFRELVVAPVFLSQMYTEAHVPSASGGSGAGRFVIHQQTTGKVVTCSVLNDVYLLALQPWACDAITVVRMCMFRSSDRSAVLYAACIGDTSRYAGIALVERNVFGAVQPVSDAPTRPPAPPCNGLRQWSLRARVASSSASASFALQAYDSMPESCSQPISIHSVRVLGCDIGGWELLGDSGVLNVALQPSLSISNSPITISIVVSVL
ncbi:hypothetical protein GGI02_003368 [Coemansia sp. RSA 2322]|uniref:Alpha-galactosidase n=1 Tax=Coemansia thaxteri TaxID=2663907 RepID=A0A9W8B9E0_9FUNG|nr:hypothetical protein H4R26_005078 [Coemansia thaxteri]KAJ2469560.1 hypothetical protein GGI02_003368 [Coemansia sp. RSA 2322]